MKRILFVILLIPILFIASCGGNVDSISSNKPYIDAITPDKTFGSEGEAINIVVSVKNPTKVNYNGNVLIQADSPRCFGMGNVRVGNQNLEGYIGEINVLSGNKNSAKIEMEIPQRNEELCYSPTTDHKLTVFLLQEGETNELNILDSKDFEFSLFE